MAYKAPKDQRMTWLTVRLLRTEKDLLEAHAAARKLALSEVVREALAPVLTPDQTAGQVHIQTR